MLKSQRCFKKPKNVGKAKSVKDGQMSLKMGHKVIKSEKTIYGEKAKQIRKSQKMLKKPKMF